MGLLDFFSSATRGGPFRRRDYTSRHAYRDNYAQLAGALVAILDFETHLDLGCGQGLLLEPLVLEHRKDSHGVEGSPAAREFMIPEVAPRVETRSLLDVTPDAQYDLVSCVEVLEHIPEPEADRAIGIITRSARKWVYFSAAIPRQPGVGHINCQPTLYWMLAFARHGWELDLDRSGELFRRIRGMQPCWWLPQNALIFAPRRDRRS